MNTTDGPSTTTTAAPGVVPATGLAALPLLYSVRARRLGGLLTAYVLDANGSCHASINQTGRRWHVFDGGGPVARRRYLTLGAAIGAVVEACGLLGPGVT